MWWFPVSDYTELVAEARKYRTKHATPCRANGVEHDCTHEYLNGFPAEILDALADALEAAEARAIVCEHQNGPYLRVLRERDEARRIAEQWRTDAVGGYPDDARESHPLPWESPTEGSEQ